MVSTADGCMAGMEKIRRWKMMEVGPQEPPATLKMLVHMVLQMVFWFVNPLSKLYTYIHIYLYIHRYTHIYIYYIYIHRYTHIYIYIYTHKIRHKLKPL